MRRIVAGLFLALGMATAVAAPAKAPAKPQAKAAAPATVDIAGALALYSSGQQLRASEAEDAIVYFRPAKAVVPAALAEPGVMTTRRKQFVPRVLAIPAGSSVRFPNEDTILHNVFSRSPDNGFDAGLYGAGKGFVQTFEHPGLVKVYCNVHHSMYAYVLVLDTPFFARPDREGRFLIAGVPEGEGDLVVYHERGEPYRQRLNTVGAQDLSIRMDLDRRKVPPHTNKFGKPYGRGGDEPGGY